MRIRIIVHGFVQGVGYRSYVRRMAGHLGVRGYVKNLDDGSVLVIAEGDNKTLAVFEKEIDVSITNGIQVMSMEKSVEPDDAAPFAGFRIEK